MRVLRRCRYSRDAWVHLLISVTIIQKEKKKKKKSATYEHQVSGHLVDGPLCIFQASKLVKQVNHSGIMFYIWNYFLMLLQQDQMPSLYMLKTMLSISRYYSIPRSQIPCSCSLHCHCFRNYSNSTLYKAILPKSIFKNKITDYYSLFQIR